MKADVLVKRHGSTHLVVVQLPEDDAEFQIDELLDALIDEFEETSVLDLLGGVPEGMLPADVYAYGKEKATE